MSVIPLLESAEYTMRINLDEVVCDLRVYWSEFSDTIKPDMVTDGCWFVDLSNELFTINGIKLVTGAELMWPYSISSEVFGGLFIYDMTGENADPDFEGMNDRWQLNYIAKADILSFREALKLETV